MIFNIVSKKNPAMNICFTITQLVFLSTKKTPKKQKNRLITSDLANGIITAEIFLKLHSKLHCLKNDSKTVVLNRWDETPLTNLYLQKHITIHDSRKITIMK